MDEKIGKMNSVCKLAECVFIGAELDTLKIFKIMFKALVFK